MVMIVRSASDLRDRITIYAPSTTIDDAGQSTTVWREGPTIWASVAIDRVTNPMVAGRDEGLRRYKIITRDREDIGSHCRLVWGEINLDVTGVLPDDGRFMAIRAIERQAD